MALIDKKITTYANPVSSLPDKPSQAGLSAAQLKAAFDANATGEIKTAINGIIDVLLAITEGASGADNIGSTAIVGVDGTTVQAQLESIKSQLNSVALGLIPDDSLTNAKLNSDVKIGSLANLTTIDKTSVVNAINEKPALNHASANSIYGLGTWDVYGHVKTINSLEQAIHEDGKSLSAYQGKLLKGLIDEREFALVRTLSINLANGSSNVAIPATDFDNYNQFLFVLRGTFSATSNNAAPNNAATDLFKLGIHDSSNVTYPLYNMYTSPLISNTAPMQSTNVEKKLHAIKSYANNYIYDIIVTTALNIATPYFTFLKELYVTTVTGTAYLDIYRRK